MARDIKNYYQDTPKQIKKKIALFKTCKVQYQEYLAQKTGQDGQPDTEDVTMSWHGRIIVKNWPIPHRNEGL